MPVWPSITLRENCIQWGKRRANTRSIQTMAERPTFIDLSSGLHATSRSPHSYSHSQASPRVAYFDGEIPPAMSPLDAFAMQSRLLAKQLDDSQKEGRRLSRLPPLSIANSFSRPRPGYLRSTSAEGQQEISNASPRSNKSEVSGSRTEVAEPFYRPKSYYPRLSGLESDSGENLGANVDFPTTGLDDRTLAERQPLAAPDYFSVPRFPSPEFVAPAPPILAEHRERQATEPHLTEPVYHTTGARSSPSMDTASSQGYTLHPLDPPRLPHARPVPSVRSVPADSSEDDNTSSAGASWMSEPRELSSSSSISASLMPSPPLTVPRAKSSSMGSEVSAGGNQLPRPSYNFSRPLSRSSRPSIEMPSRQPSSESQQFVLADDTVHTPVSIDSEDYFSPAGQAPAAAPSYIYAKYSLPRGRMLQRDSQVFDGNNSHRREYEQPPTCDGVIPVTPTGYDEPLSPLPTPSHVSEDDLSTTSTRDSGVVEEGRPTLQRPVPTPLFSHRTYHSTASTNSASTIRPMRSRRTLAGSAEFSAEDHLSKGIERHEQGSLNESTYHLRIAAKQNHPTAMLLYALACRHGWGMRPNQREGVEWLRKAADSASLEVADDEDSMKEGKHTDFNERNTRRAQFALSIYELGVSHMNGWGIEQDKALALRCFEIAGTWGDGDALAEAGFCYAQGVGCKKDLKKAARFYRMAESKGMSTIGNSWYGSTTYGGDQA